MVSDTCFAAQTWRFIVKNTPTTHHTHHLGCGATGDGDVHLRFAPCFHVVHLMREGWSATKATETVVRRMVQFYPQVQTALMAVDAHGNHGAACSGWTFVYNVMRSKHAEIVTVKPIG